VNKDYVIENCGSRVYIPVKDLEESLRIGAENNIPVERCTHVFRAKKKSPPSLKEMFPELDLHSYVAIGDIVVFHPRIGVSLEALRRAADYLVSERGYRSVYAKVETAGVERKARLIHLSGEDNPITVFKEYGLEFKVDIANAYANPRLGFERRRIASLVQRGEMVIDLFAGIGGYALHISNMVEAEVVALDINSVAAELMVENIERNQRKLKGLVHPVLGNALFAPRMFNRTFDRVIADNPTMHDEFIGVECGLSRRGTVIHHYMLSGEELDSVYVSRLFEGGGCKVSILEYRKVLPYSPRKNIWSVTLRVDKLSK
jgi:tRNA (guanine37-N1)-methyltransferase